MRMITKSVLIAPGKPFNPDEKMKAIFEQAALEARRSAGQYYLMTFSDNAQNQLDGKNIYATDQRVRF